MYNEIMKQLEKQVNIQSFNNKIIHLGIFSEP